MMFSEKFPWEVREDADTIRRYNEIKSDPERIRKAQECIKDTANTCKRALGEQVAPPLPGRKNPATIMSLDGFQQVRR